VRLCFDRHVQHLFAIGLGGFAGALARYGGVRLVHAWTGDAFPFGTLLVNVLGSFLLGWILATDSLRPMDPDLRAALAVGFCGSFTTMSSFSFETLALLEKGAFGLAAVNAVGSLAICLLSVWMGVVVARSV
jgi:CrcB protein